MNFLQYIEEGIRSKDFTKSIHNIVSYLEKHLGQMYLYGPVEYFDSSYGSGVGVRYFLNDGKSIRFNWKKATGGGSQTLESITIWVGTSTEPNFLITAVDKTPLGSISLVQVLPTLVKIIKNPAAGSYNVSAEESTNLLNAELKMLRERVLTEDPFEDVVNAITSGPVSKFNISKMGRNQERIFTELVSKHKNLFTVKTDGAGRQRFTFVGNADDLDREDIVGAVAGSAPQKSRAALQVYSIGAEDARTDAESTAERKFPNAPDRIPFEEQMEDMKTIIQAVVKGASNFAVILGGGGLGKALPNHYPVLTPTGWTPIVDLRVGDAVVAQDGTTAAVTGVFPQGVLETMVVSFADGRTVECSPDHLWEVNIDGGSPTVIDTKTLKTHVDESLVNLDRHVTVPLFEPSSTTDVELPIDPYLLGTLLGSDNISTIVNNDHTVTQHMTELGLISGEEQCKFIPELYKLSSVNQRTLLLQGLLGDDGIAEQGKAISFSTPSELLATEVQQLVFSIGGSCRLSNQPVYYLQNDTEVQGAIQYSVSIQYPSSTEYKHLPVSSIMWTGISEECTCISINHPRKLYVTKSYVPTHNTFNVEKTLSEMGLEDGAGYFKNTSSGSPAGLYRTLFMNKTGIVVLDDCDTIVNTQEGRNLLKAALDTKKRRKIVWGKSSSWLFDPSDEYEMEAAEQAVQAGEEPEKFPKYFDFEGRVILISNLSIDQLDPDGALSTRGFVLTLDPTKQEVAGYMKKILPNIPVEGTLSIEDREAVLELIIKQEGSANIRKLVRGLNMAASGVPNWQRIVARYA